ncbi:hypothetical protein [Streptomyces canus]|uniref:hypothetical protein n=1 Tax=Streptomyces canus TaxID=58343 RepID=UPI00324C68EA
MSRRRQLVRCAAVLSVLIGGIGTGLAHAATGTALYVDDDAAGCSDTGPGSPAEPFCQIQPAADSAGPGDTVHVARNKTPYAPVNIGSIGAADAPVTFVAAPGDNAAATAAVVLTKTSTPAMTFSGAQYVAYGAGSLPNVSNVNLSAGETRPVLAVIPIDAEGSIHIRNANGSLNIVADLEGYIG